MSHDYRIELDCHCQYLVLRVLRRALLCGTMFSLPDAAFAVGGSTLLRMGTARLELRNQAYALPDKAFRKIPRGRFEAKGKPRHRRTPFER